MKKDVLVTTNPNEAISSDNVQYLGELIALKAMKTIMRYSGKSLDSLYRALIKDVYRPDSDRSYSDAYDIAQEAICFLCRHIGHRLGDEFGIDRFGKHISIKTACYRYINHYLEKVRANIYFDVDIDDLPVSEEPVVPFEPDYELSDWTKADAIIEKLDLNKGQLETLSCYMSGIGFVETARLLDVNNATVWRRMKQVREKYITRIAVHC